MTPDENREQELTPSPKQGLDLVQWLASDHQAILDQFKEVEQGEGKDLVARVDRYKVLENGLKVHLEGEERFLYTALEKHEETVEQVLEAYEEHLLVKTIIGSFNSLALDDHRWTAKIRILKKLFELHIREQYELFDSAKRILGPEQASTIVQQLRQLKEQGSTMRPLGEPLTDA